MDTQEIDKAVAEVLRGTAFIDIHTHLFAPSFGLMLWGIDELLTYHYLEAELFRFAPITPEQLIYKWRNTRRTIAPLLAEKYKLLADDGRAVTRADIQRDVDRLFRGNFERWIQKHAD